MLQNIREHSQGWIAKVIIGVIILLMALTGFEAIIRAGSHQGAVALVNGEEIRQTDLNQAVEMQRRSLAQRLGPNFDPALLDEKRLRDAALKALIERELLLQDAKSNKFAFSEAALDQLILQTPEFQVDGQFNAQRFDQTIAQMGYSRLQFREMLKQEMLMGQLRAGIAGTGFVTDAELNAFAALERQTRDFATHVVKADASKVAVTNDELQGYYDDHRSEFMTPDQVVIDYIELKKSAFADKAQVKQEDLQALYQSETANLSEQRNAAHILIEVNDKVNDEQAKAKIDEIKARLDKGEDFAALAKKFSQDPGSANKGGELGYAGRGVYDPAFEEALYGLNKGDVSAPVHSTFGWHLIKLLGVQEAKVPSLESMKPRLEAELKAREADRLFVDATRNLESAAFEASDLSQPAQEQGLKVQTSKPFGREGGEEGVIANRQVVQAAFSPEVLEDGANSNAIQLDDETAVILRVKEHRKPAQQSFDDVKDNIRSTLTKQKIAETARQQGETLIADLKVGKANTIKDWKVVEAATRNQEGVDPVVLQQVFRMNKPGDNSKPTYAGVNLADGTYMVIRLTGVSVPQGTFTDEEKAMYRRFLSSRSGQEDFAAYRRALDSKAEIKNL
ncbi:SurA N-terminal domain-containing protein [Pseudomonas luteola]|uniref:SurA N-terminal domain-containing protein n=1 Tax=Pseudomonas luteola TaxID=47886 RepID=UPI00123965D6|nr:MULTISPECIES: SurA N-terminal domain-containing protein [Pseudomonas]MBA1250041.1 peptidylprolyl isomerase [Pseudomonas zeshuii]QEU28670.1 peptidylprolyl isomerase [Pseudomonas luteola]